MEITVTVCDACRMPGRETQQYTISSGAHSADKDLCDEDAGRLEAVFAGTGVTLKRKTVKVKGGSAKPADQKPAANSAAKRSGAKQVAGTAATKAAAPKTHSGPGRRSGMVVRTLAEIEQEKQEAKG